MQSIVVRSQKGQCQRLFASNSASLWLQHSLAAQQLAVFGQLSLLFFVTYSICYLLLSTYSFSPCFLVVLYLARTPTDPITNTTVLCFT